MFRRCLLGLSGLTLLTASACGPAPAGSAPAAGAVGPSITVGPSNEDEFGLAPADEATPTVTATLSPPEGQPTPVASPEDCVSYNPSNLTVVANGDAWILRDGSHSMLLFDTYADADNGRKAAHPYTRLCFIGRGNDRADQYRYIITYFKTSSGLLNGTAPTGECIPYNPATLAIYAGSPHPADPTQDDYALYAGPVPLLFLATEPDALRAKQVAAANTKVCLIGHGNSRPNPTRYIHEYFRA